MNNYGRDRIRAMKRRKRRQEDGFGPRRPLLARRMGPQKLALLRSVNNPVITAMAGPTVNAAAAGGQSATIQVQGEVPAGAVLWVDSDGNWSTIDTITVDGQNIYTGGAVPVGALDPSARNAVGIFIPRAIRNTLTVQATATAAGNLGTWLATASLEVEQTLDATADCECDDDE